ncbi:hypothetical protein [Paenibacillus arenilitoris]|uniref:Uncharacterized protein n=1 Tax=Paenibacillus arenilitoris TaxID=2772299 RepID=A0A927CHE9_9BACL|nr:hypothetical protein [Paenibacillus arenilitoris]MBD2867564.1 hypothetical protein [Paenibacillus arenilitoris]
MKEQVMCPWCLTEIVWDEEIGPEKHCPHCENELSAYRTIELGYGEEEEAAEDRRPKAAAENRASWNDEEEESDRRSSWLEQGDYRSADRSWFAVEHAVRGITDDQAEAPECPACREFMLEAGTQTVSDRQFEPRIAPSLNGPVLTAPFTLVLYVCPACFHTSSVLSREDREQMIKRLTPRD